MSLDLFLVVFILKKAT